MLTEAEKYLVSEIQNGDYRAFKTLFDIYYSDLFKYAITFVHPDEDAEDLVQDFFVKLWEQPHLLAATVSLKGYMYRSIYNSCINFITRTHLRFRNLEPDTVNKLDELFLSDQKDSAETGLLTAELTDAIEKAVDLLPVECGKIFLMSREEGHTNREIARELQISENTVKVQIHRALSKLREELAEFF
jgi:RNA polymerase sigma-70 factor (ECF subfamily)